MKSMVMIAAFLALGCSQAARADNPESGFYLGGAFGLQWIPGTGTWAEYDFEIDSPLDAEGDGPVGFGWTDKMLLGIKPIVGYRVSPIVALQVGYAMNIPKSSQQSVSQTDGLTNYEQGFSMEWEQRSLEILGVFNPDPDGRFYLFAGLDMATIETKFTLYEGVEYLDYWGNLTSEVDAEKQSDTISATGFILGGGIQFASDSGKTVFTISAQYSTAETDDSYFSTEDFKVKVGGISLMFGVNWYAFNK